jgi:hypothetical protein
VGLAEGMLFVKLPKTVGDWLWHSDMIGNKPKLGLGCFGEFVMGRVNGRMESIGDEVEPIALCGSLPATP